MHVDRIKPRLGLNVPYEWWPGPTFLKEIEAAGFSFVQVPSPPDSVLRDPRQCARHAAALREALEVTALECVVHGPGSLRAGDRAGDLVFAGLLSYAAEAGSRLVVYHAANFPDEPTSEDALLAETRSLAELADTAERLEVSIAIENIAPVFPAPEPLSATPMLLRTMAKRIGSPALGVCVDVGHANVVAGLRHTDPLALIEPAIDSTILFHVHDNLGARHDRTVEPPGLDPLRLDLHLAPGRGTVPWSRLAHLFARSEAPLLLEVHPQQRPASAALLDETLTTLTQPTPLRPVSV